MSSDNPYREEDSSHPENTPRHHEYSPPDISMYMMHEYSPPDVNERGECPSPEKDESANMDQEYSPPHGDEDADTNKDYSPPFKDDNYSYWSHDDSPPDKK